MGYVWCEICVGYVWCEIRQQSSEEPCDETSFGKKIGGVNTIDVDPRHCCRPGASRRPDSILREFEVSQKAADRPKPEYLQTYPQ